MVHRRDDEVAHPLYLSGLDGDDPIVRDMNLYVYSMLVYRVEKNITARKEGAKAEKRPANLAFIEPQMSSTFGFRRHKMRLF